MGQVTARQGFFSIQQACPRCRGAGQDHHRPLYKVSWSGPYPGSRRPCLSKCRLALIPVIESAWQAQGEAGANGGPAGDLYVQVKVRAHAIFTRAR